MSSTELARQLERWRDDGMREARFLIGGADGFDDAARRRPTCCSPSAARPGRICSPGRCSPSNCSAPPDPCQPSLSSRRMSRCARLALLALSRHRWPRRASPRSRAGDRRRGASRGASARPTRPNARFAGARAPGAARDQRGRPRPRRGRGARRADRGGRGRPHRRRAADRAHRAGCRRRSAPGSRRGRSRWSGSPPRSRRWRGGRRRWRWSSPARSRTPSMSARCSPRPCPRSARRTAALRAEVDRGDALRRQADEARPALRASREELRRRRVALAALRERAARALGAAGRPRADRSRPRAGVRRGGARPGAADRHRAPYQARLAAEPRRAAGPVAAARRSDAPSRRRPRLPYLAAGRGPAAHRRRRDFRRRRPCARPDLRDRRRSARAVAPAAGRIVYAAPFRSYGNVVIIDHGGGWTTVITDLAALDVSARRDGRRAAPARPRRARASRASRSSCADDGRPFPLAPAASSRLATRSSPRCFSAA